MLSLSPSKPSKRKCVICKAPTLKPMAAVCSIACAIEKIGRDRDKRLQAQIKADRKELKARKEAIKPLEYWLKRAEKAFNSFIRKRDEGCGCISCGRFNAEVWNAGHYVSVGANRTLRFNEDNVHLQCARPCNKDKGGNIHAYRLGLIAKIGLERVEALEGWHDPVKMTVDAAKAIEAKYKAKTKELEIANQ